LIPVQIEVCGYDSVELQASKDRENFIISEQGANQESYKSLVNYESLFKSNSSFCPITFKIVNEENGVISDYTGLRFKLDEI
jgi:hypothetical protein